MASLRDWLARRRRALRLRRPSRAFWFGFFALLAVAGFLVQPSAGSAGLADTVTTFFLAAAAVLAIAMWHERAERALWCALVLFIAGVLIRVPPFGVAEAASDGLIVLAVMLVVVYLCAPAVARIPNELRGIPDRARQLFNAGKRLGEQPSHPIPRAAIILALAVSLFFAFQRPGAQSWSLVGSPRGNVVWNAHVIGSNLTVQGRALLDPSIASVNGAATRVAIVDVPILDALKFAHSGELSGPTIVNLAALLGLWGLLLGGMFFVGNFCESRYAAAGAMLVFFALPLSFGIRFDAPFDLLVPVVFCAYMLSAQRPAIVLAAFALGAGLTNTASGYELAVLLIALRLSGYARSGFTWVLAALGALGSAIFALATGALAPNVSLAQAWWSTDQLPRIFRTEGFEVSVGWTIIALVLVVFGIKRMVEERAYRPLQFAATLAGLGLLFAIPTHLGGVPIISLARILQILPLGWPSARMLELAIFALTIPIAFSLKVALDFVSTRVPMLVRVVPWVALGWLCFVLYPKPVPIAIPNQARGTTVVEFPIAEAGSVAGIAYADDLLVRGQRIVQPIVFVESGPLSVSDEPGVGRTQERLRRNGVSFVVMRGDLYETPSLRTVEPQVYDAKAFTEPHLQRNADYQLAEFAGAIDVYRLNPR